MLKHSRNAQQQVGEVSSLTVAERHICTCRACSTTTALQCTSLGWGHHTQQETTRDSVSLHVLVLAQFASTWKSMAKTAATFMHN